MLAVTAIVCLIVLVAVLMRGEDGVVVVNATPGDAVVAARAGRSSHLSTAEKARVPDSKRTAPIVIHVTAEMEGGCKLPKDTQVAFLQLTPEGTPLFAERRLLADVARDSGGYELVWRTGASELSVVVESRIGALPGVTMDRADLGGLRGGIYRPASFPTPKRFDSILERSLRGQLATHYLHGMVIRGGRVDASEPTEKRTLELSLLGSCGSMIVLELPIEVTSAMLDRMTINSTFEPPTPHSSVGRAGQKAIGGRGEMLRFDFAFNVFRGHPMQPGTYSFTIVTSNSRTLKSGEIVLGEGEVRRSKLELMESEESPQASTTPK